MSTHKLLHRLQINHCVCHVTSLKEHLQCGTTTKLRLLHLGILLCLNQVPVCTAWRKPDIHLLCAYISLSKADKEADKDLRALWSPCT